MNGRSFGPSSADESSVCFSLPLKYHHCTMNSHPLMTLTPVMDNGEINHFAAALPVETPVQRADVDYSSDRQRLELFVEDQSGDKRYFYQSMTPEEWKDNEPYLREIEIIPIEVDLSAMAEGVEA